jgi:DNA-binding GntR family transcriptional regulator
MLTSEPSRATSLAERKSANFARPNLVRDEVYEHIKLEILSGKLPSGERLGEIALAERLGVSRTPVREAVQRLVQDGLIEVEANKGAKVRALSIAQIEETYAVREALDGLAARLAATHRTEADLLEMRDVLRRLETLPKSDYLAQVATDLEFHAAIASASRNTVLDGVLRGISETVTRVKQLTRETNQTKETRTDHHAILNAIEKRDPDTAEHAARAHVRRFQTLVIGQIKEASDAQR